MAQKSIMEEMGPAYWEHLHGHLPPGAPHKAENLVGGFCDTLVCGHCAMGCKKLMSGIHDLKNMQLGKPVFFPENFKEVQENFAHPDTTCIGICPARHREISRAVSVKRCSGGWCRGGNLG